MELSRSTFLDACRGRNHGPIPIWVMRQAGRYLPEYRRVREQNSFEALCRTPELIAEVVYQPVERFGFDAAILFSDILTMLDPMGVEVRFPEGGPRLAWRIESPADAARLHPFDVTHDLHFVYDGIAQIKRRLPDTPLIGFVGSPFTLLCYLVEGQGSKTFDRAKRFVHEHPDAADRLLRLIAGLAGDYLAAQVKAGADAVQVFDSWGGILSYEDYPRWSLAYSRIIFDKTAACGVPRILFVNNTAPYLDLLREAECEVIGVDYRMNLAEAFRRLPGKAIQGNLDPSVLFEPTERVRQATGRLLRTIDDPSRWIFNLGHGIQPQTPVESVQAMIDVVREHRS